MTTRYRAVVFLSVGLALLLLSVRPSLAYFERFFISLKAHQGETKSVTNASGIIRRLPQYLFTAIVLAHDPVHVRQVHVRARKLGIESERRPVVLLRPLELAELRVDDSKVHVGLGPIGVELLDVAILFEDAREKRSLLGGEALGRHGRQHPSGFDANPADVVVEERNHELVFERRVESVRAY